MARSFSMVRANDERAGPTVFYDQHRQDETRRTVDLGHSSDGPSWIDLAAIRVNTTESRFEASLNRLLQQNRHEAAVREWAEHVRSARVFQTSTCSAIARASSTSMPR